MINCIARTTRLQPPGGLAHISHDFVPESDGVKASHRQDIEAENTIRVLGALDGIERRIEVHRCSL